MNNKIDILIYLFTFYKEMKDDKFSVKNDINKAIENLQVNARYWSNIAVLESKIQKLIKNEKFSIIE